MAKGVSNTTFNFCHSCHRNLAFLTKLVFKTATRLIISISFIDIKAKMIWIYVIFNLLNDWCEFFINWLTLWCSLHVHRIYMYMYCCKIYVIFRSIYLIYLVYFENANILCIHLINVSLIYSVLCLNMYMTSCHFVWYKAEWVLVFFCLFFY